MRKVFRKAVLGAVVVFINKALLEKAQTYSYAVGAFNLYNLEDAKAVVNAAEADNSPAIIQILPHILKGDRTKHRVF